MATAFVRTILLYLLIILCLRLLGKRQIGELEPIELVLTLLVSDLAAVPMQDLGVPFLYGVIPIVTLMSVSMLFSYFSTRSIRFRQLVCGQPTVLIREGEIQQRAMLQNRFTLDELIETLRAKGITDLRTVKYAILETDGQLSALLYPDCAPATPRQLGKSVADTVSLPTVLISNGRTLKGALRRCGLDGAWLEKAVRAKGFYRASEVFLLSIDERGEILCIGKETK